MRTHDIYLELRLREMRSAHERALAKLRLRHPKQALAYELRDIYGLARKVVAYLLDTEHRPENVSDWVKAAREFLAGELAAYQF